MVGVEFYTLRVFRFWRGHYSFTIATQVSETVGSLVCLFRLASLCMHTYFVVYAAAQQDALDPFSANFKLYIVS